MFSYSNARPCGDRAFFLVEENQNCLFDGLSHILEAASELLSVVEQEHFIDSLQKLKKDPETLFLFSLLNDELIKAIEDENYQKVKNLFCQFSVPDNIALFEVFSFNHGVIPKSLENSCKNVLVSEFPEKSTVQSSTPEAFDRAKSYVQKAFEDIKKISPVYYKECEALVSAVLILNSKRFIAGSSFSLLGLVTLADKHDIPMTMDYLIHETAHQYLYNLMANDEIISGDGLFSSPLRKDPRPISGIYHAVFVLARLIDFFKKAAHYPHNAQTHLTSEFTEGQIENYTRRYYDGLAIVEKHGQMTDLGRALLESTKELVGDES